MQDRVDALAPTMSREAYGSGGVNQRSPKPARRERDIRDQPNSSSSKYYGPSSISQPVSGRGSPLGSRTASTDNPGRRSSRYGVSRSSNASPLTIPADGPVPHSISTSAFNVAPSGSHSGGHYYNEDLGSPTMDSRGHHRSRSATRVPLRNYHSLERDQDREFVPIRDPRDRSLDRTEMAGHTSRHPRSRERSLDRSGYRERDDYAYRDIDGPIESDPYRDTGHSRSGHGSYGDSRHGYGRSGGDSYVMELQTRLNDLQLQYNNLKRELEATTQKLGSSMHSIKTFWSPELKKERALRKEEAAKYALLNDQMKTLRADNAVSYIYIFYYIHLHFFSVECRNLLELHAFIWL